MKKTFTFILAIFFLMFAVGCSKKTTNEIQERNGLIYQPNEEEPFTGTYKINYSDGASEEINYSDGKLDGLKIIWSASGQKLEEINYNDGEKNGLATTWLNNGQKITEDNYNNGKLDGKSTEWFNTGEMKAQAIFKDGKFKELTQDQFGKIRN